MSSDQRYQSQLFNFILRQSRELADQWQRNIRQARVASFWGMQMALYPVYLLFQVTRLSEQVLRQADAQGQRLLKAALDPDQSPLQGAGADTPIRRVLESIQIVDESDGDEPATESQFAIQVTVPQKLSLGQRYQRWFRRLRQRREAKSHQGMLQGLASDLDSRHLVLITPENESLDVLGPEQQKKLLQLMTWEVAHYSRQQRLNHQLRTVAQVNQRPLQAPKLRSQMLPPVRGFRRLMGWFQTSPMATTTNLFQEAQAVDPLLLLAGTIEPLPLPENLGPTLRQLSPQITPEALEMMDHAIASWETLSRQIIGSTAEDLPDQIAVPLQQQQTDRHLRNRLGQNQQPVMQAAGWFQSALSTLFGTPASLPEASSPLQSPESQAAWPAHRDTTLSSPRLVAEFPVQTINQVATLDQASPSLPERITIDEQGIEIDVDAVFVEYEQHPLERILNALDRVVSWFEKRLFPWLEESWSAVKVYFQQLGQP